MEPELKIDEVNFRTLLRNPERLFGYTFFYVLAVLLGIGVLYVSNLTTIGKNSVPPLVVTDTSGLSGDIPYQTPRELAPVDVIQASHPTVESLRRGRELYGANCSSCHGENGLGDGSAGILLNPKPRNLHDAQGWTNGVRVTQIYKTLQEGIVRNGMASYSHIAPADLFAIVHVVRSFQENPPLDTPAELEALEAAYQLSRGISTPGQIPVRAASRLILEEHTPRNMAVEQLAGRITAPNDEPGSRLVRRVVRDPIRLAAVLTPLAGASGGERAFIRIASSDPGAAGLSTEVSSLNSSDWRILYRYLSQRVVRL